MASSEFSQASLAYTTWLKNSGVWVNEKVKIADLRDIGRGRGMSMSLPLNSSAINRTFEMANCIVVASSTLEANEALFRIPYSLILCSFTSSCPQTLLHPLQLDNKRRTHWFKQILVLLYERALGAESKWAPYVAILPQEFDTPIFWTADELAELQACDVVNQIGREEMDSLFQKHVVPLVLASPSSFGFDANDNDLERKIYYQLHVCASILMAYAFDLNKEEGDGDEDEDKEPEFPHVTALVPPADILNADEEHNVSTQR
jgi:N-lysine methyltransferase SETD6